MRISTPAPRARRVHADVHLGVATLRRHDLSQRARYYLLRQSISGPTKAFEDALAGGRTAILRLPGAIPVEGGVPLLAGKARAGEDKDPLVGGRGALTIVDAGAVQER